MKKYIIKLFDNVEEAENFVNKMSLKGYFLKSISINNIEILVTMKLRERA